MGPSLHRDNSEISVVQSKITENTYVVPAKNLISLIVRERPRLDCLLVVTIAQLSVGTNFPRVQDEHGKIINASVFLKQLNSLHFKSF